MVMVILVVTIILVAKMIIIVVSVVEVFNRVIMFFQGTASPVGYGERVEMARRFVIISNLKLVLTEFK